MSGPILNGKVLPAEVSIALDVFNDAIAALIKADVEYETILCGMSSALAMFADPEDDLDGEAMDIVMFAVKDVVRARDPELAD
jgi:hypothetical protein